MFLFVTHHQTSMQQLTLEVHGMSCGHCVNAVKQALAEVPGVTIQNVSIGQAVVTYEPDKTKTTDITDALADIGYEAHATP
jgi:copper chaperone